MAAHGVSRATRDLDLLAVNAECLSAPTWTPLEQAGFVVTIRPGDADDPLAGVVRFQRRGEAPVDLILGRFAWQAGVIERARVGTIDGVSVPVAAPTDLILLKLYAGGPQDAWDIEQLLAGPDRDQLIASVEATLDALPQDAARLWARIVGSR
jgi:hypothetical protein